MGDDKALAAYHPFRSHEDATAVGTLKDLAKPEWGIPETGRIEFTDYVLDVIAPADMEAILREVSRRIHRAYPRTEIATMRSDRGVTIFQWRPLQVGSRG